MREDTKPRCEIKLGLVIPTKDRPRKLLRCLSRLSEQDNLPNETIVVASGTRVNDIVERFTDKLNIEYIHSDTCGQIHQRNLGAALAKERGCEFIFFLDDDMILQEEAITNILYFISEKRLQGHNHFGVGLNMIDETNSSRSTRFIAIKKLLGYLGKRPGTVTTSGYNTSTSVLNEDIRSQWLGGGYTVWSSSILEMYPQEPVATTFAAAEDLLYSYPIGKKHPLYVCSRARVIHDDLENPNFREIHYRNRKKVIAHLYLCSIHKELNPILHVLTSVIFATLNLINLRLSCIAKLSGTLSGVKYYLCNHKLGARMLEDN